MNHTNKQDQRPAFQFYPKDWLSDTGLRCCTLAAKGLWIDLLSIMWTSPLRGALKTPSNMQMTCKQLANLTCKSDANALQKLLNELEENGVLSRLEDGTIINRRMYFEAQREKEISEKRREAASKRYAKGLQNTDANEVQNGGAPTATPSSSPTPKEREILVWFGDAWKNYPRKDGKKGAWNHYRASVKTEHDRDQVLEAIERYKKHLLDNKVEPKFIKVGSTFFNNWQDWVEYEEPPSFANQTEPRKPPYYYFLKHEGGKRIFQLVKKNGERIQGDFYESEQWKQQGVVYAIELSKEQE